MATQKILLIGAGPMAVEYAKVFAGMQVDFDVIGRSEKSAQTFQEKTGKSVTLHFDWNSLSNYTDVIVAVSMEQLGTVTSKCIQHGAKKILVEKPSGMHTDEITKVANEAKAANANVYLAYNRRFYASVLAAQKMIEADGGITSMHFEFTEWSHQIKDIPKADGVKENWFLGNSTHVVDLAFFLGGLPKAISCYKSGSIQWHPNGAVFTGAGITQHDVLFSYCANWAAPGRWGVEVMTNHHRLILKPLEKLQLQKIGSVAIEEAFIDDTLDKQYKPGLYLQCEAFLHNQFNRLITIQQQAANCSIYDKMMQAIH